MSSELAERITLGVMEQVERTLEQQWDQLISYEQDAVYEAVQEAIEYALAAHNAPLGR